MRAKLDQVQVGGQEGSLAEAMSGASVAPSRPGSEGNRRKAGGWSLGASGWFGVLLAFQEPKGAKKESGSEQKGEPATCLSYSPPFPLSCQFPPDSPCLQHFLSLGFPVPYLALSSLCCHSCSELYLAIILSFHLPAKKSLMLGSPGVCTGRGGTAHILFILTGAVVIWGGSLGLGPLTLGEVQCLSLLQPNSQVFIAHLGSLQLELFWFRKLKKQSGPCPLLGLCLMPQWPHYL